MSNTTTYQQFVNSIVKPGDEIICQLTPQKAHLLHMAVGVSGEAGELLDAIKKHCVYQKQIDLNHVMEEAGDILFYLTGLLSELDMTIEECINANMDKLSKRYPQGTYSNSAAIARADKLPDTLEVKAIPNIEDDFEDVKIKRVCNLDDETCESCQ
jgi:NTP pyrophosphatase (non-canonical NTP hydrolase)